MSEGKSNNPPTADRPIITDLNKVTLDPSDSGSALVSRGRPTMIRECNLAGSPAAVDPDRMPRKLPAADRRRNRGRSVPRPGQDRRTVWGNRRSARSATAGTGPGGGPAGPRAAGPGDDRGGEVGGDAPGH